MGVKLFITLSPVWQLLRRVFSEDLQKIWVPSLSSIDQTEVFDRERCTARPKEFYRMNFRRIFDQKLFWSHLEQTRRPNHLIRVYHSFGKSETIINHVLSSCGQDKILKNLQASFKNAVRSILAFFFFFFF